MNEEKLLSVGEFADRAKRGRSTIYTMIATGELKVVRKQVRNRLSNKIPESELKKFTEN